MEENEKTERDEQKNSKVSIKKVLFIVVCLILIANVFYGIYFVVVIYPTGYFRDDYGNRYNRYLPWHQDEYEKWGDMYYNGGTMFKPIIYFYPESATELTVKLGKKDNITCSYPKYQDGWNIIAYPDGTLVDKETNKKLYALYWEGKRDVAIPMNDGFVVKGEDSSRFLEEKLAILGLNEKETEEFIIYWLPKLEANKYNLIRFQTMEEIEQNMPLTISKTPDTLIRVWMQFKGLETRIEIPEQNMEYHKRDGFTVVEWGGTEVK